MLDMNNIYCQNYNTLMISRQEFTQTDSDSDLIQLPHHKIDVCVLKHLPMARKILDGHNRTYQIYSPRCLYSQQLARTSKHIMPKIEEPAKVTGYRLFQIEDAVFQHSKMKEKIKELYTKSDQDCHHTLWDIYGDKEIYYSRFEGAPKKQNFGGIFMNFGGINLQGKLKASFPQIKSKAAGQIPKINSGSVIFDSHFQSGNLLYVFKNNDERNSIQTFDLILQNDINTKGHNQWFYFKITNTKKNQKVKLNIVNLVKKQSLFSYGLKPLVFSQKSMKNGQAWHRNGLKVCYQENNIKRQHKNQSYYTLSFEYQFRQAYDTVYFAPSYPYTYAQLLYFMDSLLTNKNYENILSIKKVTETVGKNTINLISISTGKQTIKDSKIIWILGRQHPVETTSSFMIQGIITYLLNLMVKANKQGDYFYDNYIFKIIPMVNPDGTIHGNTRAELTGIDPNRVWKKTSKTVTPAIHYIKKQILKTKDQACLILDLHSHSKKLGCFFYGNYDPSNIKDFRRLPSTICQNDIRFCYKNSRFRGGNDNSARRTLFNELNLPNIFTVQCSLLGYIKENRINQYKVSDYHQMGVRIISTFFQLERQNNAQQMPLRKSYPHQQKDFCDAQSARSDSCVSDDEYQEVYIFAKAKKKLKDSTTTKPKSNSQIYTHKSHTSDHPISRKPQSSSKRLKYQIKSEANISDIQGLPTPNNKICKVKEILKLEDREDTPIRLKNRLNSKNIRLNGRKRAQQSIKEQLYFEQSSTKTYNEKSIQVEQLKTSNNNIELKPKAEKKRLIVVGSAVEEDKIFVGKNEVGVQMDNNFKENASTSLHSSYNYKPNSSNKFIIKCSKRVQQENQVRVGKSTKLEKRGVLMFRN